MEQYDAVVVLGGGLRKEGHEYFPATYKDSDEFGMLGGHMRVQAAVDLYRTKAARSFMFTTGVYEKNKTRLGGNVPAESEVYAERFQEAIGNIGDIQPNIILDTTSTTTLTNMQEVLSIISERKWHYVAIVSNEYHIPRIRALYEYVLRQNPKIEANITFLSAEKIVRELQPGKFDQEIDEAYASEQAKNASSMRRKVCATYEKGDMLSTSSS